MRLMTLRGAGTVLLSLTSAVGLSPAQKMGHSNTDAPLVTQTLDFREHGQIELRYTSITWAAPV